MTPPLRVVSLFSGVGGFDLGLERAGMVTVAQVEWDKKCQSVLARHWPDVPRWGDVSEVNGADLPDCDLVAFGSPCQDLSVAGKRAGMVEGETRSGLFYEAVRIIKEMLNDGSRTADARPRWVVWENVVGALSSNDGLDFAAVLDSMAELGAVDVQYRVLDAQHFGVPQRRRRVFVVARLDPRAAGREQVLPLGARVRRDSAARGEAREVPAGSLRSGSALGGPKTTELDGHGAHVVVGPDGEQTPTPLGLDGPRAVAQNQRGELRLSDVVPSVVAPGGKPGEGYAAALVPFVKAKRAANPDDDETWKGEGPAPTLNAFDNGTESRATVATVTPDLAVRRLTPRECERLMGWPDDWTRWAADGSEVADSSRYRMCGNGVASPVAEWIGRCIVAAHAEVDE